MKPVKTAPKRISGTTKRFGPNRNERKLQMRTKLIGAFIAALAMAAFAALPAAAMAEKVTLKEGPNNLEVGTTIRATSLNTIITWRTNGISVACAKTSIRAQVRTNPGARVTLRNGGTFLNAAGADQCKVEPTEGRVTARIEDVRFRKDIDLQKIGPKFIGRTTVRFTLRVFDEEIHPGRPIAVCSYEGPIEFKGDVGSDAFIVQSETDAELEPEVSVGECDERTFFTGDFELTRRDGTTPVRTN
jgi:hypothetical protein